MLARRASRRARPATGGLRTHGAREIGGEVLSDEEIEERLAGRRWVFAYDPVTGERVGFTSCPERRVPATRMLYEMDGYRVEVMTVGEVDEMVGRR